MRHINVLITTPEDRIVVSIVSGREDVYVELTPGEAHLLAAQLEHAVQEFIPLCPQCGLSPIRHDDDICNFRYTENGWIPE